MSTWSEEISLSPQHENQSILSGFKEEARHILRTYAYFNIFFIILGSVEITCCLIFFNLLTRSSLLAITLATFLMTLFSYFILRIYFQSKRPEQLLNLSEATVKGIKDISKTKKSETESILWLASSLCRIAHSLKDFEYNLYKPSKVFYSLSYTFEKFGCWLHWKDVHMVKEWLYFQAIEAYIQLIKNEPNNLQFHVALANTYIMLSNIYSIPKKIELTEEERWIPPEKFSKAMHDKFTLCAKRTVEEFKILNDYNPNDPWVYTQLAYSYHDLQMPQEEIRAYESILKITPDDADVFYKLGILYFQQGFNAKGLKVYEKLKARDSTKAESLIRYYGAYSYEEALEDA
ncbi:MAG: hypothetical protein S4CHLAM7_05030 [Chlamydiae bacterium]|nr:hypothetical protein [Chlamydiota bacterium]